MNNIKIIAHRGGSGISAHENTLEAFEAAIETEADMVEFDIRTTKDKVMVVFHDNHISGKKLQNITYKELNNIAAEMNYRVPTLEEVLDKCKGRIQLDIELKEAGYEKNIIDEVKKRYGYDEYTMKSFNRRAVANIKKIDADIKTGLLVGKEKASFRERIREYFPEKDITGLGCDFVSPYYKMLTPGFCYRMHRKNIGMYPWTVNKERSIIRIMKKGVEGIITDRPDIFPIVKKDKR
jgi:glycerophosphoryl diester phosphodiesterase